MSSAQCFAGDDNAGEASDWAKDAGEASAADKAGEPEFSVRDFMDFSPGNPFRNEDEAQLVMDIWLSTQEGKRERHVVDSVESAIYQHASPKRRVTLAHLVNQGGLSVKVADAILDARGDPKTALTYLLVFCAIDQDPVEIAHIWQEYFSELGEVELPEELEIFSNARESTDANDDTHDPYDRTFADDDEESETDKNAKDSNAHDRDFDS